MLQHQQYEISILYASLKKKQPVVFTSYNILIVAMFYDKPIFFSVSLSRRPCHLKILVTQYQYIWYQYLVTNNGRSQWSNAIAAVLKYCVHIVLGKTIPMLATHGIAAIVSLQLQTLILQQYQLFVYKSVKKRCLPESIEVRK